MDDSLFAKRCISNTIQRPFVPITLSRVSSLGSREIKLPRLKTLTAQYLPPLQGCMCSKQHGQHLKSVLSDVSCPRAPRGSSSVLRLVSLSHYWPPRPRLSLPWPHPLPSPASVSRPQLTSSPHLSSAQNHSRLL